jgi:hypothetical protein
LLSVSRLDSAFGPSYSQANSNALAADLPFAVSPEEISMREKVVAIRDTAIVLGLQIAFRLAMMLRRWNY